MSWSYTSEDVNSHEDHGQPHRSTSCKETWNDNKQLYLLTEYLKINDENLYYKW